MTGFWAFPLNFHARPFSLIGPITDNNGAPFMYCTIAHVSSFRERSGLGFPRSLRKIKNPTVPEFVLLSSRKFVLGFETLSSAAGSDLRIFQ